MFCMREIGLRFVSLGQNDDETVNNIREMPTDEPRSEQQRLPNGNRGDDFYKKLMFYEQNSSTSNSNGYHQPSTNSSRRSLFQQSPSIPSTSKGFPSSLSRQTPQTSSRPNLCSANSSNKQTSAAASLVDRMQRSKSYKDLFDPPTSSSATAHQIYYQPQSHETRSSHLMHPSSLATTPTSNPPNLFPYYSSSFYYSNTNGTTPSSPTAIVGSMLGNAPTNRILDQTNHSSGLTDFQRRQQSLQHSTSSNNLLLDDVSSSSTVSHLPKPPPGIPSQNARYASRLELTGHVHLFAVSGVAVTKWIT
jgi:hypothetical protein